MSLKIRKAEGIGFCFGVRRAIDMLENSVAEKGDIETLGAVVHNDQVLQRLAEKGITVADSLDNMKGDIIAISSHGVGPQVINDINALGKEIIDTTCPFVYRAQTAARKLSESGFYVVIYGDANHREVEGLLGWVEGKGIAALDMKFLKEFDKIPRRIGVISQTTQIQSRFNGFAKKLIDNAFSKDSELHIMDTICHDSRRRQESTYKLAKTVDLMLVVGSRSSANTRHLAELCSKITKTYHIESAGEIRNSWLDNVSQVGVTSGASTAEETIKEVISALEEKEE